jgi:hypothetical protein
MGAFGATVPCPGCGLPHHGIVPCRGHGRRTLQGGRRALGGRKGTRPSGRATRLRPLAWLLPLACSLGCEITGPDPSQTLPRTTPQPALAGTLAYVVRVGGECDRVVTHTLANGRLQTVLSAPGVSALAWAPEGGALVIARQAGLVRYATDGTGGEPIFDRADRYESSPEFAPDGRLAYRSGEWCWVCFEGPYLFVDDAYVATARFNGSPAWRHDRDAVVIARNDGLYEVAVPTGRWARILESEAGTTSPHVSIQGSILYVEEGRIQVADGDGRNPHALTNGPGDGCPRWSPDGSHIAYTTGNGRAVRLMRFTDGANWQVAEAREGSEIGPLVWARGSP